jgi:hypothetical protein
MKKTQVFERIHGYYNSYDGYAACEKDRSRIESTLTISHLKKVFSSDIGVEPSSQAFDILEYICGLILGFALISTENLNFEMASIKKAKTVPNEHHCYLLSIFAVMVNIHLKTFVNCGNCTPVYFGKY